MYMKLIKQDYGGDLLKMKNRKENERAVLQNTISSLSCMAVLIGFLLLSRRWLIFTELIFPAMVI